MSLNVQDFYNIFTGRGILDNPTLYLRKPRGESEPSWKDRAEWATFPNWCKKAFTVYMGYLFYSPPKIVPADDYCILELSKKASHHSLIGGYCWIIVLLNGPAVYKSNQIIQGVDGKFNIISPNASYEIDFKTETIKNIETGESEKFIKDQLIKVVWNESQDSLFVDIGPMNIDIYNMLSVKKSHIMRSLQFFIEGKTGEVPKPYDYIQKDKEEAETKFIQLDNTDIIKTIINDIIQTVLDIGAVLGISSEFARELRFQVGISKMIDLIDTSSVIRSIGANISKYCNQAADVYGNITNTKPASIEISPILRPDDDDEALDRLSIASNFINIAEITKLFQQKALKISLPDFTVDELEKYMKMIENGSGERAREILNTLDF